MSRKRVPNPSQHIVSLPAGAPGAGGKNSRLDIPPAVILATDILRWLIPKVGAFPKSVRFGLGVRLESAHLDVLEELIRAQYTRGADCARALDRANTQLQIARHFARLARDLGLFSEESAVYLAGLQVDLGNQVGAWRKASVATANSSANSATQPT
jgi:hypothetical protein